MNLGEDLLAEESMSSSSGVPMTPAGPASPVLSARQRGLAALARASSVRSTEAEPPASPVSALRSHTADDLRSRVPPGRSVSVGRGGDLRHHFGQRHSVDTVQPMRPLLPPSPVHVLPDGANVGPAEVSYRATATVRLLRSSRDTALSTASSRCTSPLMRDGHVWNGREWAKAVRRAAAGALPWA